MSTAGFLRNYWYVAAAAAEVIVPTGMEVMVDYWPEVVVDNQTKSLEFPYMEEFQVVLTASLLEESPIFLIINGEEIVQCLA